MSTTFELASHIQEETLANDLKILLKPVKNSSVISCWMFYKVGSRNESPGVTGSSHWVEHMQFKGGGRLGKGDVFHLVSAEGGRNNAFTDQDLTVYYETLPKDKLEIALFIESERMTKSSFDQQEVESERQVIISEREGSENHPTYLLREEIFSTAFRIHPYRWPVVGWKRDLQSITRNDLYNQYRHFYSPNNAVLVISGNFENEDCLTLVRKYFENIESPSKPPTPDTGFKEPDQTGERTSKIVRKGTLDYLAAAFHAPSVTHEDIPSLVVLTTILAGWHGLIGFSADQYIPKSNRLYKKLIDGKIASEVNAYFPVNIDPGLLYFDLTILPGVTIERAKSVLFSEFSQIADSPPTEDEMKVAFNQIRAWHAYENDGVALQAQSIGIMELMGDRTLSDTIVSRALTVSPEKVSHVARKYLDERNRSVCGYVSRE